MSAIKWFRKNNKKLLAVFGVLLMIGFLLPNLAGRGGGRGRQEQVLGYFRDDSGEQQEITTFTLQAAKRDLDVLRAAGISQMAQFDVLSEIGELGGMGRQLSNLGGVGGMPVMALQQLLFPDSQFSPRFRASLHLAIEQGQWADDPEAQAKLIEQVDELSNADVAGAALYYVLLLEEANRLGIHPRPEQIETLIRVRKAPQIMQALGPFSVAALTEQLKVTSRDFRQAIGNYIAILRTGQMATGLVGLSQPELERKVLEEIELGSVAGDYIVFSADQMASKAPEPQASDLEELLARYRESQRGEVSEENPHGLGYMLADRVQVEYLTVDVAQVEDMVAGEFLAMDPKDQEDTVQKYWERNKHLFREAMPAPADEEAAFDAPAYRDPDFDEVADRAQRLWQRQQARTGAEQALTEAKRSATKALAGKELDKLKPEDVADYAGMVEQFSSEAVSLSYGKSEFISRRTATGFLDFANAFVMRKEQRQKGLLEMLFDCAPLHEGVVSRYDLPPAVLYEDIGPVVAFDFSNNPVAVYLLRIVAVDKARAPLSIDDDGRQGAAEIEPLAQAEGSELVQDVEDDWRRVQAYELARKQAEIFAAKARTDWDAALADANSLLNDDPCNPVRFQVDSLDTIRNQIDGMRQFAQQNPAQATSFVTVIAAAQKFLRETAEHARELRDSVDRIALVARPDEYHCAVFKDLKVVPPTEDEYLLRRPLIARQQLFREQQMAAITHYNPENIRARSGFEVREPEEEP